LLFHSAFQIIQAQGFLATTILTSPWVCLWLALISSPSIMADNHIDRAGREPRPRRLQQVVTLDNKKAVVEWMNISEALEGREGLIPRTIATFPEHFRGNYGANFMRASRWWADQDTFLNLANNANPSPLYTTRAHVGKLSKQHLKVRGGRGPKAQPWVLWLYDRMNDEFDRLRKIGNISYIART
jgi:hypothetical protein